VFELLALGALLMQMISRFMVGLVAVVKSNLHKDVPKLDDFVSANNVWHL
jgi:hypothetical protein